MKNRTVQEVAYAKVVDMGGFPVRQPMPSHKVFRLDPFLLLHHAEVKYPKGKRDVGVGPHPHRGFSPVTFIFKGGVHHRDSLGNERVIYEGGVQWMNAGKGIIHSERPPKTVTDEGGQQEIIQLWINTPQAHKMDSPSYQPLAEDQIPNMISDDNKTSIHIVAGTFEENKGPIHSQLDIIALRLHIQAGGSYHFSIPENHNAFLYLLDGEVQLENYGSVTGKNLIAFKQDGDHITINAKENTRAILLSGKPLEEPVVMQGPFVMNHQDEIIEAMQDYESGKMGRLVEKLDD